MNDRLANYLRTQRKRAGLSQKELGMILGYDNEGAVSRHERMQSVPPLEIALAYETIFGVPVSEMFAGLHESVGKVIEDRIEKLAADLRGKSANEPGAIMIAQKLEWLTARRNPELV